MKKITMNEKLFKILDACREKDKDGRPALKGLHVTDKHIEATDGKMLVRASAENIGKDQGTAPGVYRIVGKQKIGAGIVDVAAELIKGEEYPDTEKVIPKAPGKAEKGVFFVHIGGFKDDPHVLTKAVIDIYRETSKGYSAHLLARLAPAGAKWVAAKGKRKDAGALRMDSNGELGHITAVIMPFEVN